MKKRILVILRVVVLLACLVFLIYKIDFNNLIYNVLSKLPVGVFLAIVILSIFKVWLNGIRWKIVNTDNLRQLSDWDYFRYMMVSSSFNLVMPGALGGDTVKAIWVGSDVSSNKTRNVLSIFFDRVIGIFSIVFLGLFFFTLSSFFNYNIKIIVWIITLALLILFILLMRYIKIGSFDRLIRGWQTKKSILLKIKQVLIIFEDIVIFFLKKPQVFIYALLLSIVMHVLWFAVNYIIAYFLGIRISFYDISMISCMVWFITAIPVSISGIGIREISYISLLSSYGISAESATGLSLYVFSVSIIVGLLGLPFIFTFKRKRNNDRNTLSEK